MDPTHSAVADPAPDAAPRLLRPPAITAAAPEPLFGFPAVTDTFSAEPRSISAVRRAVRLYCGKYGISEADCDSVLNVAVELATNAVVHSGSPSFEFHQRIAATKHGTVLHVEVTDRGRWAADATEAPPDRDPDEGGRGWPIVERIAIASGLASDLSGTRGWAHVQIRLNRRIVA